MFNLGLFKQTIQFVQQINVKNVHPVDGAGIRTARILFYIQNCSIAWALGTRSADLKLGRSIGAFLGSLQVKKKPLGRISDLKFDHGRQCDQMARSFL